jgi:hypothetical protein
MKEINRKRDMLSKLYDPDLLVPIINKNENKIDMIKDNLRKSSKLMKKTTFNNSKKAISTPKYVLYINIAPNLLSNKCFIF